MKLTIQQLRDALIKSGLFYDDDFFGIQFSYREGARIENYLVDLLSSINEVLEETEDKNAN